MIPHILPYFNLDFFRKTTLVLVVLYSIPDSPENHCGTIGKATPLSDRAQDQTSGSNNDPMEELKCLFKTKGAGALPQGLLDDFIRSASPSAGGAGEDEADGGGVTLEELFEPVSGGGVGGGEGFMLLNQSR